MKKLSPQAADECLYILVHADDFAIKKSMFRADHDRLKQTIRAQCRLNIKQGVPIIFTELDCDNPPLPAYLEEFDQYIVRVPNEQTGNLAGQIKSLKRVLINEKQRNHYIFAGGWRDACLRYTVNNVGYREPRFIVNETRLKDPEAAVLKVPGYRDRDIRVQVDWLNVF